MDESKLMATLVERYLTNRATDDELEVLMDLLRQGKLDDLIKSYMDQEVDSLHNPSHPEPSAMNVLRSWRHWLKIAASISVILY